MLRSKDVSYIHTLQYSAVNVSQCTCLVTEYRHKSGESVALRWLEEHDVYANSVGRGIGIEVRTDAKRHRDHTIVVSDIIADRCVELGALSDTGW